MTDLGATRVDLDDSRVVQVMRQMDVVTIELEQCRAGSDRRIVVVASGVTREDAEYYVGHNVTAPHPDPMLPLDVIEFAELGPSHLELGGYLKNESWFVWRITAKEFDFK